MKNKGMIGLQSRNILLIFVTTVIALLVSTSSQMQMVSASVEGLQNNADITCKEYPPLCNAGQSQGGSQGNTSDSSSSGASSNPNQQAIDHINQAQSALENGDTEGAKMHMDAAKQALGCNKIIDPNC
jgi:hypothetical protein